MIKYYLDIINYTRSVHKTRLIAPPLRRRREMRKIGRAIEKLRFFAYDLPNLKNFLLRG